MIRAFAREVVPGFESGRLRPVVDSLYSLEDATNVLDRLGEHRKLGKVLLEFTA